MSDQDVPVQAITDAVRARMRALPHGGALGLAVTVYDGEVPPATEVPTLANSTRIAPYAVLYVGRQPSTPEGNLADSHVDAYWSGRIVVAAGFRADAERAADRLHGWLHRWTPTSPAFDGFSVGRLRPPLGFETGPMRRDANVTPPRLWLPLEYRALITR